MPIVPGGRAEASYHHISNTWRTHGYWSFEKMRGPENSKIKLKIMRKGQDKPIAQQSGRIARSGDFGL